MKKSKVALQKGKINPNPVTMAMETFSQKDYGDNKEASSRRSAQKPKLKMPKK